MRRLLLILVLIPVTADAFKYSTRLEDSSWHAESSPYVCSMKHMIDGYGSGQFVHVAGETQRLQLTGLGYEFAAGKVQVVVDPPDWKPERVSRVIREIEPKLGEIEVEGELTTEVLAALSGGMFIGFKGTLKESNQQPFDVFLSSVGFKLAYEDFKRCEDKLLPASFAQLQRSRIQYQPGESNISKKGLLLLDHIIAYVKTDATIQQVFVDGHTDNTGKPRDNVTISEKRAAKVTQYLVENGYPVEKIVTRYHGDKYPVTGRDRSSNPAVNRRTTIRLSRDLPRTNAN